MKWGEGRMDRRDTIIHSLAVAVPSAFVTSLVLGILDDHLSWPIALAIAIVPGVLSGLAAHYLYRHMAKQP